MRATAKSTELKASAYAGTYVVSSRGTRWTARSRRARTCSATRSSAPNSIWPAHEVERYWLRGDQALPGQGQGTAARHARVHRRASDPGFLWADYTAKAGTRYVFRIVPLFGTVKIPKLDDAAAVTLDVTTEIEGDQPTGAATGTSATTSSSIAA